MEGVSCLGHAIVGAGQVGYLHGADESHHCEPGNDIPLMLNRIPFALAKPVSPTSVNKEEIR